MSSADNDVDGGGGWSRDRPVLDPYAVETERRLQKNAPRHTPTRTASAERRREGRAPPVPSSRWEAESPVAARSRRRSTQQPSSGYPRSSTRDVDDDTPSSATRTRVVSRQSTAGMEADGSSSVGGMLPPSPAAQTSVRDFAAELESHRSAATAATDPGPTFVDMTSFMAQSAYTQQNPFRQQSFAEFAANPVYEAPAYMEPFEEARVQTTDARKLQGDLLVRRVMRTAEEGGRYAPEEVAYVQQGLLDSLRLLEDGDWFYKWTVTNRAKRRFLRLNLKRGYLQWFLRPDVLVAPSYVRLCEITDISAESVTDSKTGRGFLYMRVRTPHRNVCFATEIREKFNLWYETLQRIVRPNVERGVPRLWGRPSDIINGGTGGAVGRWASRYSPLHAAMEGREFVRSSATMLHSSD